MEGPQASKFSTPPPSPPGTELRHVFVDPWDYVHQGQSKSDSTNSLKTEDVIDILVEHLKEAQRLQNQAGPAPSSNCSQTRYNKQFSAPNLTTHSQERVQIHQQMFDLKKISGSLQALHPPRQSQNHNNYSHGHLEQVREGELLRRADPYENIPSTISPPFTPCVEQTSLQEQTGATEDASQQGGLAGALAGGQKDVIEDTWRRQAWEQGNIDYMGVDAFENIWKKISKTVGESIKPLEAPVPEALAGVGPEAPSAEAATETSVVDAAAPVPVLPSAAEAPEEPAAEAPVEPAAEAPVEPAAEAPVEPAAEAPAEPAAEAPAVPAAEAPAIPATEVPAQLPSDQVPAAPAAPTTEAPAPQAQVADKPTEVPEKTEDKTDAPKPEETKSSEPAEPTKPQEALTAPAPAVPPTEAEQPKPKEVTAVSAEPATPLATTEPAPEKSSKPKPELPQEVNATPAVVESSPNETAPEPTKRTDSAKEPPQPAADPKTTEPPKDGAAEAAAAPADSPPSSPAVPSPASPSAPEGASEPAAPSTDPKAETSTPPQTPVGEVPIPPKRRSTKGKAKK